MDLREKQSRKSILQQGSFTYNLETCRWRILGEESRKKRALHYPSHQGYIHQAVFLNNSLYLVFSPDPNHPLPTMLSYSFRANEWKEWHNCNLPSTRDSFVMTVNRSQILIYGGSNQTQQFGDLYFFNAISCEWASIPTQNIRPRNPMLFADVNNDYVIMYGGNNLQTGDIYEDCYLLQGHQWTQMAVIGAPKGLNQAKMAVCGKRAFVFGGGMQIGEQFVPNSQLFQLIVDPLNKTVTFKQIAVNSTLNPSCRISHGMLGINQRYFMLIGGEAFEAGEPRLKRDLWLFDTEETVWRQINPMNGPIRAYSCNSLVLHNNFLYILGGLTEEWDKWNEQILSLEFGQANPHRSQLCNSCIQRVALQDKEDKSFPKKVVVTTGFFYNMALQMKHPFQAIMLLRDCAAYLHAKYFRFSIEATLDQSEYIQISFDGQTLTRSQFQELTSHSGSDQQFSRFATHLKTASLRLGKTVLFISSDGEERKVMVLSADSKVAPAFDEEYVCFSYIQSTSGRIYSHQGQSSRQLILNIIRARISSQQSLWKYTGNRIVVFQKNIFITSEKNYYYELISNANNINVYKNNKKISFLQEVGYSLTSDPQLSLYDYASIAQIIKPEQLPKFIINNQESVPASQYLQLLKQLQTRRLVRGVAVPKRVHDVEIDCQLWLTSPHFVKGNLGVLVFYEGRFVNRLDSQLGDLFKEEFYKAKFKKPRALFEYAGVIDVKKGLQLNYFKTWFRKTHGYYQMLQNLRDSMRRAKQELVETQEEYRSKKLKI